MFRRGVQCELEASVEVQVHTKYVTEPPPKYVNITNYVEAYHKADCKFLRDTTSKQYRRCNCWFDNKDSELARGRENLVMVSRFDFTWTIRRSDEFTQRGRMPFW